MLLVAFNVTSQRFKDFKEKYFSLLRQRPSAFLIALPDLRILKLSRISEHRVHPIKGSKLT
jgi:hypothetical protein